MRREQLLLRGFAIAGAGAAAGAVARRVVRGFGPGFYDVPLERTEPRQIGVAYGGAPIYFNRCENIQSYHAASFAAVRELLPSEDLHPVTLPDGRAIVMVGAFQYDQITANGVSGAAAPPYGEVMVAAVVTRRPAPPLLPMIAPTWTGFAAGAFVLHLPVTSRVARDVGRLEWGYPKFIADMDFEDALDARSVRLSEGGHEILSLTTRPRGRPSELRGALPLYSVLDGRLLSTTIPLVGLRQVRLGATDAMLTLGDHQVADELRRLELAPRPFHTALVTGYRIAMSSGTDIGPARAYLGYIGEERDLGRYTVRYGHAAPIDQYAVVPVTSHAPVVEASPRTNRREAVAAG